MTPSDDIASLRDRLHQALARAHALEASLAGRLRTETDANRFATVFRDCPQAMALIRLSNQLFEDVNVEWERLTGYSRQEAVGHSASELGLWVDPADQARAMASLAEQQSVHGFKVRQRMRSGQQRLVRIDARVIELSGVACVISVLTDVTPERLAQEAQRAGELIQHRANEQLQQQLELYAVTESLGRVGHWLEADGGQGVQWSDGLKQLAGMGDPGEMADLPSGEGGHPDDHEAYARDHVRMDGSELEFRWLHPDQRWRWLRTRMRRQERSAGATTAFGVVQDITAEHEARMALQGQPEFIQKITAQVPGVVYQFELRPDGATSFPYASEAIRDIFLVSPQEARADAPTALALAHPDDIAALSTSIEVLARTLTPWNHEFRIRHPDGVVV